MSHHYHPLENCLARIFYGDEARQNSSCGAGVVLQGGRVLTCAHVVNAALKLPRESKEQPSQVISLDFPLSDSTNRFTASVFFWDPDTDLAVLELIESFSDEVVPISLTVTDELWGHSVQAFGFPSKHEFGTWADCKLRASVTSKWVEIIDPITTGNFIQQGFSGGPVWDENLQCCVGIVVAVDKNEERRVGYLIPANKIAEKWKDLPIEVVRGKVLQTISSVKTSTLLSRVNRQEQENRLRDIFSGYNPQTPLPFVTVIHGDDKQAHDIFFTRLLEEIIPKLPIIDRSKPILHYYFRWPTHIEKPGDLGTLLTRSLADYVSDIPNATREDIQNAYNRNHCPVVIDAHLNTDDWLRHKKGILEAYLDYWQAWPTLAPGQNLFIFLFITHKTPETNPLRRFIYNFYKKRIFTQISHCAFNYYDRVIAAVLPELRNVSRTEAEDWARQEAFEYCSGDLSKIMPNIRSLYEENKEIPMETLASHLRKFLIMNSSPEEKLI